MTTRGRRRELRSECADLLKIRWTDPEGAIHKEVVTLEDISPGGVCVKVEKPVPAGTQVALFYPGGHYRGRIKHCETRMNWYFIGVEFEPGYRWSQEQFDPAHLLRFRFRSPKGKEKAQAAS